MTLEMRKALARLPYEEKIRRVAALIGFSRRFKVKQMAHDHAVRKIVFPPPPC